MKHSTESSLRKALLPLVATAVAVGAFLGLPRMKALAAAQELKMAPQRNVARPAERLNIIQPRYVNPSAAKLVALADEALSNQALAERIFQEPDAVASQYDLSENEKLVLRQMTRDQFETARADAERLRAERLASAGAGRLPAGATDAGLIAERMVVGRAILAAAGRSYLEAADAHACCPWSKAIELGVNPSRVFYDQVFQAPAGANLRQPTMEVPRSDERG